MTDVNSRILEQALAGTAEPLLVVSVDQPNWPVAFANQAFAAVSDSATVGEPFADVVEKLAGRELALEVSEAVRTRQELSLPIEVGPREFLLALRPLNSSSDGDADFFAAYWRNDAGGDGNELHHALLKAKQRIRDLSRDDSVTGLLNRDAFVDIFEHDWAVAARESNRLSLVAFRLQEFATYVEVFGRHASDSCLRRVGRAIRRCLRRASDVVARVDDDCFVVLSHAADEQGVNEFAERIATAVRELGLHHPRASASKFVTVEHVVRVADARNEDDGAAGFLSALLAVEPE